MSTFFPIVFRNCHGSHTGNNFMKIRGRSQEQNTRAKFYETLLENEARTTRCLLLGDKKVLFNPQRTLSPGLNKSALVILMEIIFLPEPRAELSKHLSKLVLGKEENPARLDWFAPLFLILLLRERGMRQGGEIPQGHCELPIKGLSLLFPHPFQEDSFFCCVAYTGKQRSCHGHFYLRP